MKNTEKKLNQNISKNLMNSKYLQNENNINTRVLNQVVKRIIYVD